MNEQFSIFVSIGGKEEQAVYHCTGSVIAGRGSDCEIPLPHPMVSRRHAEFSLDAEGCLRVRDLNSRNGTIVEGETLRDALYTAAARVIAHIGPYSLIGSLAASPAEETIDGASGQEVRQRVNSAVAEVPTNATGGPARPKLTKRERQVLQLVAVGKSNQVIAEELEISPETVKRHVSNLLTKTGRHNRTELAHDALEHAPDA